MPRKRRPDFRKLGLLDKYLVMPSDGSARDPGSKYFVLRYDGGGRDKKHIAACRLAIRVYAAVIRAHLPKLAEDLDKQVGTLSWRDLDKVLKATKALR
ncbi:MAG: hypothetical protein BWY85_00029 [Firmicutes bacterium ADurb.Bin506]|nr:MAG: hypothetical protein BWY85_00029 [Firmicutes bacterium ADurb.Bin506]